MEQAMEAFRTWAQVLDHVRAGLPLYYFAPMDLRPVLVTAVIRRDGKLRVTPPYSDADPFTADTGHLSRFRRLAARRSVEGSDDMATNQSVVV